MPMPVGKIWGLMGCFRSLKVSLQRIFIKYLCIEYQVTLYSPPSPSDQNAHSQWQKVTTSSPVWCCERNRALLLWGSCPKCVSESAQQGARDNPKFKDMPPCDRNTSFLSSHRARRGWGQSGTNFKDMPAVPLLCHTFLPCRAVGRAREVWPPSDSVWASLVGWPWMNLRTSHSLSLVSLSHLCHGQAGRTSLDIHGALGEIWKPSPSYKRASGCVVR